MVLDARVVRTECETGKYGKVPAVLVFLVLVTAGRAQVHSTGARIPGGGPPTGLQDPKVVKGGAVSIVVKWDDHMPLANQLVQVAEVLNDGFKKIGFALPKGARVVLHKRPEFEAAQKTIGLDPSQSAKTVFYAYTKAGDWIPTVHVLAEPPKPDEPADVVSVHTAHALAGLVGVAQSKNRVPPVSDYGMAGYGLALYTVSALRNGGKVIALAEVREAQGAIDFIAQQKPRLLPREILGKAPTTPAASQQLTWFLNVLLYEAPVATQTAVIKAVVSWPLQINATPDEKQVDRMEKDLADALGLKGPAVKHLGLEEKMADLGIDKKLRKEPGSLLRAYYEIGFERLEQACEAAWAKGQGKSPGNSGPGRGPRVDGSSGAGEAWRAGSARAGAPLDFLHAVQYACTSVPGTFAIERQGLLS